MRRGVKRPLHRFSGTLALVIALPVAYHCLWSLGFNPAPSSSRQLWHSLFGCIFCHGGDGSGGIGPRLAGKVVVKYPDPADQIAVVTNGRRGMPSFATKLSAEEIAAVVEYTRTMLGS